MGVNIVANIYCPTWETIPHKGWRKLLIHYLRIPRRFFKPEEKVRVMYQIGSNIICSPENYDFYKSINP